MKVRPALVCVVAALACAGCTSDDPESASGGSAAESTGTAADLPSNCPAPPPAAADQEFDRALHDELVRMLERDQAEISGNSGNDGFAERTERLREIFAEHGWPGFDLVGDDGEDAAWAIAQHADHDLEFQRCALHLLEIAVDDGQGSPGNLAYLSDRVAVAAGEPQRYGTQVACEADGPRPSTPLVDPDRVEEWRAEADLPPYDDYLEEMTAICSGG